MRLELGEPGRLHIYMPPVFILRYMSPVFFLRSQPTTSLRDAGPRGAVLGRRQVPTLLGLRARFGDKPSKDLVVNGFV